MAQWHLQYRTEDNRWVILIEWRHPLNFFRKKWSRWIVGETISKTYPVVRGSPLSRHDEAPVRRAIQQARGMLCDDNPGGRSAWATNTAPRSMALHQAERGLSSMMPVDRS